MGLIRVGVVGVRRGRSFARVADAVGMKLVALCDTWEAPLRRAAEEHGVAAYTDFAQFLEHDMEAVVLANYFHQHAPLAIEALAAGHHVMSETAACKTIGEGVALARAVEKSGKIYMFAENYPYMVFNQEMRRLYGGGAIGDVRYAEGEYNHPHTPEAYARLAPGEDHWRNHLPSTYYCTHALAPVMYVTDTMPASVNALSIADVEQQESFVRVTDPGSVILVRLNNGAVARLFGLHLPGNSVYYRFHGTRGMMESVRGQGSVHVVHEAWDARPGEYRDSVYLPDFPRHEEASRSAGHGGGDFWTSYHFAQAIKSGEQPYLDVYRGVAMSAVGILGWKSALEEGKSFAVHDFSCEEERASHAGDDWSPWPEDRRAGQPPPSIRGHFTPAKEALARARVVWSEMGVKEPD